jgi:hypothetical protein
MLAENPLSPRSTAALIHIGDLAAPAILEFGILSQTKCGLINLKTDGCFCNKRVQNAKNRKGTSLCTARKRCRNNLLLIYGKKDIGN